MNESKIWAHVFLTIRQPRKVVRAVRKIMGVVKTDDFFGIPDAVAIVEGSDISFMDILIERIAEVPDMIWTNFKVAGWID